MLSDILIEQDHNILQVCFAAKTAGEVYTSTAQVNASTALSSNFTYRNDGPVSITGRSRELLSDAANSKEGFKQLI